MRLRIFHLVLVLLVVAPSAARADAPFTWSAPALAIDDLGGLRVQVRSVDCPTTTFCVAVDEAGNVLTTSNPTGPAAGWTVTAVTTRELIAVSCPTTTLCVAVGARGDVVTSTNPAGGAGAWSVANVDGARHFDAVSCASVSLCVAVDAEGNVVASTSPAGGAGAWTVANVAGTAGLTGVACPKADLCVVVDALGRVLTSASPAGGVAAWSIPAPIGAGSPELRDVSCFAGTAICRAVDYAGKLYGTNDAATPGDWAAPAPFTIDALGYPVAISCISPSGCAVVDLSGNAVAQKSGGYVKQNITPFAFADVTCPATSLCVAVSRGGDVVTSTNPFADVGTTWQPVTVDRANNLLEVSCASETFCVTVDQGAYAAISTAPATVSPGWAVSAIGSFKPSGLSCPAPTLCVSTNIFGNVLTSTDPGGGLAAWTDTDLPTPYLGAVSCPSTSMCVAGADSGKVFWSTDPTGGAAAWQSATIAAAADTSYAIREVSCPEPGFCVAVNDVSVLVSANPIGGPAAWSVAYVPGINPDAVSCASRSLCVIAGGLLATSTDPAAGAGSWTVAELAPGVQVSSIDCAEPATCVAADYRGRVAMTSSATGGASAWTISEVAGTHPINDVDCPTRKLCVAVDQFGYATVGKAVPDPVPTAPPSDPAPARQSPAAAVSQLRDTSPPQTSRLRSKISRKRRTARFTFQGTDPGAPAGTTIRFQCRLDGGRYGPCRSPKSYRLLRRGRHAFSVRAVDAAGNVDRTPARLRFGI